MTRKPYRGPVDWVAENSNEKGMRMRKLPTLTVTLTKRQMRALEKLIDSDPAFPSMSYMLRQAVNLLLESKTPTQGKTK